MEHLLRPFAANFQQEEREVAKCEVHSDTTTASQRKPKRGEHFGDWLVSEALFAEYIWEEERGQEDSRNGVCLESTTDDLLCISSDHMFNVSRWHDMVADIYV
jgi:hypothetical protein